MELRKKFNIVLVIVLSSISGIYANEINVFNKNFKNTIVSYENNILKISTGLIEREWRLNEFGLKTVSLKNVKSGKEWISNDNQTHEVDWKVYGVTEGKVIINGIDVRINDDEGFTSQHLEVNVEMFYPQTNVFMRYIIFIYPNSNGIKTQYEFRRIDRKDIFPLSEVSKQGITESYNIDYNSCNIKIVKYRKYGIQRCDMYDKFPMMEEFVVDKDSVYAHATLMILDDQKEAMAIVKESPILDNPSFYRPEWSKKEFVSSYLVGGYEMKDNIIYVTGTGIAPSDILSNRYRKGWATWTILSESGDINIQKSIKEYDRLRFPINKDAEMLVVANHWGSTDNNIDGRKAAIFTSIKQEVQVASKIGIDLFQIDDGWQNGQWGLSKVAYPQGWKQIVRIADSLNVKLGLWAPPLVAPYDSVIKQCVEANFLNLKLDFYRTSTYGQVEYLENYARNYVKTMDMKARINWDCTGPASKNMGFFYGREYGNLWIENQKQHLPDHTLYRPWRVLQDFWLVSKYVNLNKLQIPIQYAYTSYPKESDAGRHSQSYLTAISLMGVPMFFQELKYLNDKAKEEIKTLLKIYKKKRTNIWDGFIYPIGEKPNNTHWTGFQNHNETSGYLLIFRELENKVRRYDIKLNFCNNKKLELINLINGDKTISEIGEDGNLRLNINKPGNFLFIKYKVKND